MLESPKLTARQQQILDLIQRNIAQSGSPQPELKSPPSSVSSLPMPPRSTFKLWPAKA